MRSYREVWALNVEGPLVAMQKLIPLMRAQGGGSIVNISSLVSKNSFPRVGAYASTECALNTISLRVLSWRPTTSSWLWFIRVLSRRFWNERNQMRERDTRGGISAARTSAGPRLIRARCLPHSLCT